MSKSTSFSTYSQVEGKPLLGKAGIVTGALLLKCDVSKEVQVKSMVERVYNELGRIDFLVNNAGGSGHADTDNSVEAAIIEDWNIIIGANLTSAFLCTHFVSPDHA
jgi:NAD(P)-dependent dehydrogenase (short-subunit alcohol dehydrogenase family)